MVIKQGHLFSVCIREGETVLGRIIGFSIIGEITSATNQNKSDGYKRQ